MSYTLKVKIAQADREILKAAKYRLCFVKGAHESGTNKPAPGNVVFAQVDAHDLNPVQELVWSEKNQVFMIDKFIPGTSVNGRVQTNPKNVVQGETVTFNKDGNAIKKGSSNGAMPIGVTNEWRNPARIVIGSYNKSNDMYSPAFVSEAVAIKSTEMLTPVQYMGVFFHKQYQTNDMIDEGISDIFPIDLTGKSTATAEYKNGEWSHVMSF